MKKLLSLTLALAIIICAVPLGTFTFTASAETSGYYTYTVSNGKATITDVNTSISGSITIPSTLGGYIVTSIGNYAFYNCTGLTSITIPDSVTSIGGRAFYNCTSLTSVTIPDSVTSMGDEAFYECTSLTSVYITDIAAWCKIYFVDYVSDLLHYTSNPLFYAENLYLNGALVTDLVIPDGVTSIGDGAFRGCTGLTSITIPDSVISIGEYAFSYCTGLTSVTIPDSITSIGDNAFYGCESIARVYITDIAAWCNIDFGGCASNPLYYAKNLYLNGALVTDLVIPDGVTSIGDCAFFDCSSLTSVTIPDSVTSIGDYAFKYCDSLTSITIPDGVTSIGVSAFARGDKLTTINYNAVNCTSMGSLEEPVFEYSPITIVNIGNDVISIPSKAFYNCSNLTNITLSNSVTSIGWAAFYSCDNLADVYYGGSYLERFDMTIGSDNFALTNATWHYADSEILKYNYNKENLTASVIDCAPIATVANIPKTVTKDGKTYTVTSIGASAFKSCTNLTNIILPNSVTSIGSSAFYGCESLTSITIPDSVKSIGSSAFKGCNNLQKLTLPFVGQNADGTGFTNFGYIFGADDESYPEYYNADYVPSSLKEVIVTGSINTAANAFYDCKYITSISFTGDIKLIGEWAFGGCNGLKKVMLPASLKTIRSKAFYDCINLTDVYYRGNSSQRNNIAIEYGNDPLEDAAWHYNYGKITYPDVSDNAWYTEAVEYVSKNGIMSGYSNGKFGTSDSIQRQDFLVMLARLDGVNLDNYKYKSSFPDVARNSYYEAAVNWGAENGIVTGYQNGKFGVGDKVTREQLVTFLYRYAKYKDYDYSYTSNRETVVSGQYKDFKKVSGFAKQPILWAIEKGVISGKTSTTIVPQGNAQRCEVAKIMYNIYLNDIFK